MVKGTVRDDFDSYFSNLLDIQSNKRCIYSGWWIIFYTAYSCQIIGFLSGYSKWKYAMALILWMACISLLFFYGKNNKQIFLSFSNMAYLMSSYNYNDNELILIVIFKEISYWILIKKSLFFFLTVYSSPRQHKLFFFLKKIKQCSVGLSPSSWGVQ